MKLKELLDNLDDETWVKINNGDNKWNLWVADYIGGDKCVMKWLTSLLSHKISNDIHTIIDTDPENKIEKTVFICVNIVKNESKKRTSDAILIDLVSAVREYDALRDEELDFDSKNNNREFWGDEEYEAHDQILDAIYQSHLKVSSLVHEASDGKVNF